MAKLYHRPARISAVQPAHLATVTPLSDQLYTYGIAYDTWQAAVYDPTPNAPGGVGIIDTWTNTLGYTLFICGVEFWIGCQGGGIADIPFQLVNRTSNTVIVSSGWDHYKDPADINANTRKDFWPDAWYLCLAGDVIEWRIRGVVYNPTPQWVAAGAEMRCKH